ncbi:eukaryotic translation initiation factor 4 gamma-like [Stegastes partitus]|uniref:Eukaryotic translation initiation factor 4 gamma-like n=1 Tax=Stegastes partitus TaxID=144197 RepID=A0A9Y4NAB0_9TELE|nr:PREDICTED: eukaryotic translation initiation factor 4 gamma-like [Stegastes partitus]
MRLAALSVVSFLHLLRLQSGASSDAWPASSLSGFEFPEIDGSAVDTCRIYIVSDATMTSTSTTTTTTTTTTTPVTRKQVVETTKKPAVQPPPKKPEPKDTGAPIRTQPITNHHIVSLLHRLLANSRAHGAGVQPIGRQPRRGQAMSSDSDESVATRKVGSASSDSSDES